MDIKYHRSGEIENNRLQFAVIHAAYKGKWIFARHKDRDTWEIPGGHREIDEDIDVTASRELYEETGAITYEIEPVCEYSVTKGDVTSFGRLFYSRVSELGQLPESEIKEIRLVKNMPENLTYPDIQPQLHEKVLEHLREKAKKIFSWCHDCEIRRCCMDNKNDCTQCAEFSCEIINNSPDPKIKERIESLREGKQ